MKVVHLSVSIFLESQDKATKSLANREVQTICVSRDQTKRESIWAMVVGEGFKEFNIAGKQI